MYSSGQFPQAGLIRKVLLKQMEMRLKISREKQLCLNHSHNLHPQPDVLTTYLAEIAVHSSKPKAFPSCTQLDSFPSLPGDQLPSSIFHPTEENEACYIQIPAIKHLHMHMRNSSLSLFLSLLSAS